MRSLTKLAAALLLTLGTAACTDLLEVNNTDNPDVDRVFRLPATIEQTIGTGYQSCRNAVYGSDRLQQLETMSLESYSSLNNFFMGPRGGIPRSPILNNRTASSNFSPFSALSRQARFAIFALEALERLKEGGGTLGTPAQDLRAKAFGYFVAACNLGYLALTYDSSAVVTPGMASDEVPPLSYASDVMEQAIKYLDSAEVAASNAAAGGAGGFPTPAAWLSGATLSRDNFLRWVRSWRARFRAGVARTPAERDAVDWDAVIADAEAGLTADIVVAVGGSTGWVLGWLGSQMHVDAAWHQITPMIYGMADTTPVAPNYASYIAAPLAERDGYFVIRTPDKRWPSGEDRAAQQAASPTRANYTQLPYIENRKLADTPGEGWGNSYYNYYRYKYYQVQNNTGQFPEFMKAEVDLLAAEGYIRTGNIAAAAAKIDISRVGRGSLPPLTGAVTSLSDPVPGGAACVPRVPQPPNFTTVACGNILEAMKWEKRMELAFQHFGAWFWDARGWGDLPEDTALEYPTPFEELDARGMTFWDLGGGGASSAARGTYGF